MPLVISDAQLSAMRMDERQARIEIACRFVEAERLTLPGAAKLAGLSRAAMEGELRRRGIALYRPTLEDFQHDLDTLHQIGGPQ